MSGPRRPAAGAARGRGGDPPPEGRATRVSPLAVPALLGGLVLGLAGGYVLGPWAGLLVLAVVVGAVVLALRRPDRRETAVAAVLGTVVGFGGTMVMTVVYLLA